MSYMGSLCILFYTFLHFSMSCFILLSYDEHDYFLNKVLNKVIWPSLLHLSSKVRQLKQS